MLMNYLLQACRGKLLWERMKKKYGPGYHPSRYILFPSGDDEYNAWAIYYMPHYLEKFHLDKAMAVVADDALENVLPNVQHNNLHIVKIEKEQLDCLVRLCALVDLNSECTIISVKEPYDTGAERMLGKKGVTKREIVWYDIYRMSKPPETAKDVDYSRWKNAERYQVVIREALKKGRTS